MEAQLKQSKDMKMAWMQVIYTEYKASSLMIIGNVGFNEFQNFLTYTD